MFWLHLIFISLLLCLRTWPRVANSSWTGDGVQRHGFCVKLAHLRKVCTLQFSRAKPNVPQTTADASSRVRGLHPHTQTLLCTVGCWGKTCPNTSHVHKDPAKILWTEQPGNGWQKTNRQYVSVVAKNLGDELMPRRWAREESLRLLAEADATVDSQSYLATTVGLKCALDSFLHQSLYAGIISPSLLKFLMKDFSSNKSGTFRLKVKLHKNPVVGRPIMNLSRTRMRFFSQRRCSQLWKDCRMLFLPVETFWNCLWASVRERASLCAPLTCAIYIRALIDCTFLRLFHIACIDFGRILRA